MQEVWKGEARGVEMDSEESLLYKAIWSLCRQEVSRNDNQGCGKRVEA